VSRCGRGPHKQHNKDSEEGASAHRHRAPPSSSRAARAVAA
jgi:hypothetical protein